MISPLSPIIIPCSTDGTLSTHLLSVTLFPTFILFFSPHLRKFMFDTQIPDVFGGGVDCYCKTDKTKQSYMRRCKVAEISVPVARVEDCVQCDRRATCQRRKEGELMYLIESFELLVAATHISWSAIASVSLS